MGKDSKKVAEYIQRVAERRKERQRQKELGVSPSLPPLKVPVEDVNLQLK